MVGRHDLSDAAWEAVRNCLPARRTMGRPPRDPRQVLNGVFWILRTGAPWRDLPECYGPWTTVYFRFREWERDGVIDRMMAQLQSRLDRDGKHRLGLVVHRRHVGAGLEGVPRLAFFDRLCSVD